jgi:hypothetical protein
LGIATTGADDSPTPPCNASGAAILRFHEMRGAYAQPACSTHARRLPMTPANRRYRKLGPLGRISRRFTELPATHTSPNSDPGDHSSEVPSRQVGGKRAEATSPGAPRREVLSACIPRRHGAPVVHPLAYPNSAQATSGAGACWCVVAGAWALSRLRRK